jgi:hypothetical protein
VDDFDASNVYAGGFIVRDGMARAAVWQNYKLFRVFQTTDSYINAITVDASGNVYAAGYQYDDDIGANRAMYWYVNANKTKFLTSELTADNNPVSEAGGICLVGSDVYIAGSASDNTSEQHFGRVWKCSNGSAESKLMPNPNLSPANSQCWGIIPSGNTASPYTVAGWGLPHQAEIWDWAKGSYELMDVVSNTESEARWVCRYANDLYVAGFDYVNGQGERAEIWKNGEKIYSPIAGGFLASSVAVANNNLYALATPFVIDISRAQVYKDDISGTSATSSSLLGSLGCFGAEGGTSIAWSIAVDDSSGNPLQKNNIFVAGTASYNGSQNAVVWRWNTKTGSSAVHNLEGGAGGEAVSVALLPK